MKQVTLIFICCVIFYPVAFALGGETRPELVEGADDPVIAQVRRQKPAETPDWVNSIPDRLAVILIERHLYKDGPVWGCAKSRPDQELPFDEMGSATFLGIVKQYDLFDT